MAELELDPSSAHIAYALLGSFIIVFGLVSLLVKERLFISEAFVSTAFGIIIGPYAIGLFDPLSWKDYDNVTLELTRIVIAVQVMAAGVEALVIAACVTPTDPVLSNSVVKGRFAEKHVPPRIRYLLSAESGINDGMGLPFLMLGVYLIKETNPGTAVAKWFYMVWAYQILLSVVLGGLIGAAARKLVKGAKNRNLIDKESFLVFSIALALAVAGIISILASDDLLACFVAGNVFAWDDWFSNEIAEAHIQEVIDMLLNLACFVYIGASIPFKNFHDAALELSVWRLIVLAILILLFRRLPFVMALKRVIPALTTYREAAFSGWFGPIGVGAVFFSKVTAMLMKPGSTGHGGGDATVDPNAPPVHNADRMERVREVIFPVVMFMVLSSVLIHGITVPLLHLQYKYTRTWSRKREDSNHVVSRLPHINIGDDIVLRPPSVVGGPASASTAAGSATEDEIAAVGGGGGGTVHSKYDHQRSIGYDHQRSIGYDHQRSIGWSDQVQRSINGRSIGGGYGFPIAGVPDLTLKKTNTNASTTRTLQDVVQEMKEAARTRQTISQQPSPQVSIAPASPQPSTPASHTPVRTASPLLPEGAITPVLGATATAATPSTPPLQEGKSAGAAGGLGPVAPSPLRASTEAIGSDSDSCSTCSSRSSHEASQGRLQPSLVPSTLDQQRQLQDRHHQPHHNHHHRHHRNHYHSFPNDIEQQQFHSRSRSRSRSPTRSTRSVSPHVAAEMEHRRAWERDVAARELGLAPEAAPYLDTGDPRHVQSLTPSSTRATEESSIQTLVAGQQGETMSIPSTTSSTPSPLSLSPSHSNSPLQGSTFSHHQLPPRGVPNVVVHEVEREEDHGVIRTTEYNPDGSVRVRIEPAPSRSSTPPSSS
ncbi:hypothetical protein DFQ26_002138 [Actinomortierella ambigua]|nr:hypothetical protein DFQ26_002138 [Actinomortierella ambigua]